MGTDAADATPGDERRPADGAGPAPPAIDVARLAQKVYTLMRDELRLERARGAVVRSR